MRSQGSDRHSEDDAAQKVGEGVRVRHAAKGERPVVTVQTSWTVADGPAADRFDRFAVGRRGFASLTPMPKRWWSRAAAGLAFSVRVSVTRGADPIPADLAKLVFTQAHALAAKDGGALWGQSLAGPLVFVDPATRAVVANQDGAQGGLHEEANGVFTGTLATNSEVT